MLERSRSLKKIFNNKPILAGFTILLTILAYPPLNFGLLSWIALVPLLQLLNISGWKESRKYLLLIFIFINAFMFSWLFPFNRMIFLLLVLFFSLLKFLYFLLIKYFIEKKSFMLIPLFLVLVEYLQTIGPWGFPIGMIGYTQFNFPLLIQLADIGGVWIISFLIYLVNVLVFKMINSPPDPLSMAEPPRGGEEKSPLFVMRSRIEKGFRGELRSVLLVFLVVLLYGFIFSERPIGQVKVGLIQPNTNMYIEDWGKDHKKFFQIYADLSKKTLKDSPDLIIWPETSIGLSLRKNRLASQKIRGIIDGLQTDLLIGNVDEYLFSLRFKEKYNSAFYIDKNGLVLGEHKKNKLIPMIELANYQLFLPWNIKNKLNAGLYLKGEESKPMSLKGYKAATVICFESLFGDYVRRMAKDGANVIYNLSSDGWSTSLQEHYFNFVPNIFRAIENRRYVVRVSDNGISAVISPRGKIISKIDAFEEGWLVEEVKLLDSNTFYQRFGDLFVLIIFLIFSFGLFGLMKKRKV